MRESRFPAANRVVEIYGSGTQSLGGPIPPSGLLANLDRTKLARHASQARRLGFRLRYLFDANDMEVLTASPDPRAALRSVLGLLTQIGIDAVAVTVPLLVEWIREDAPELDLTAWIDVASVRPMQAMARLGCSGVAADIDVNRDFARIESMVAEGGTALTLLANPACLLSCSYRDHKTEDDALGARYGFTCQLRCHLQKVIDPVEFVKTPWIRPEDLPVYEAAGIASVRLERRNLDETGVLRLIEIYLSGRFDGNLVELIDWGSWGRWAHHPTLGELPPMAVYVDNRALDDFLGYFRAAPFRCHLGCGGCQHCPTSARQAVRFDPALAERYRESLEAAITAEVAGRTDELEHQK